MDNRRYEQSDKGFFRGQKAPVYLVQGPITRQMILDYMEQRGYEMALPKHKVSADIRKRDAAVALPTFQDIRATAEEVAEQAQDA
jgi:hypothetical protein